MKNIKKYICLLTFLSLCSIAIGQVTTQQITFQSPTVSSLMQYADCPVSYYSGTPGISIPLYEIAIDNFKIPISLSYYASGIKVSQEASWVGLGWSLNAGGCISRSVQCFDDFLEYLYPGVSPNKGYYEAGDIINPNSSEYYTNMYTNTGFRKVLTTDSEPDIFYYSFLGYSGKFLLDKSRGAVLFDKSSGIKVNVEEEDNKKYFILLTPDGIKYVFSVKEKVNIYSKDASLHNNLPTATNWDNDELSYPGSHVQYTSCWFLSKIITPNKREILFTYESELYKSPAQESCIKYNLLDYSGNTTECAMASHPYYSVNKSVYETYRLSRISWDNGSVEFASSTRADVNSNTIAPGKLDNLKVYDGSGNLIKGYNFAYGYFDAEKTGEYAYVFKRLRLDSVTNISDNNYRYNFNYFPGSLPAKNSKDTDYWGYYNGKDYGSEYYAMTDYQNTRYSGADKKSDFNFSKIGTLNSIQYPTGETENFVFEANTYQRTISTVGDISNVSRQISLYTKGKLDEFPELSATDTIHFTLNSETRVILSGYFESYTGEKDKDYNLSNDIIQICPSNSSLPVFRYNLNSSIYNESTYNLERAVTLSAGTYVLKCFAAPKDFYVEWRLAYENYTPPSSSTQICQGGGLRIAQITGGGKTRKFTYSTGVLLVEPVTSYFQAITCSNQGSTWGRFIYLMQLSESTIPLSSFRNGNQIGYDRVEEAIIQGSQSYYKTVYYYYNQQEEQNTDNPFIMASINYTNGLLKGIDYYRGGVPLKYEDYEYTSGNAQIVRGFRYDSGNLQVTTFDYLVEWNSKHIIKSGWYGNDSMKDFETENEILYNSSLLPKLKKSSLYDRWHEERTYYPTDYTDTVSQGMVAANYIGIPVEQLSLVDGQVVSGHKVSYQDTLGMYLPAIEYTLENKFPLSESSYTSAYKEQVRYDIYNTRGKLLQKHENGMPIVYLWSYNGEYPVAEIRNITYQAVVSALSLEQVTTDILCEEQEPTKEEINALNSLRTALPQAQVTIYTYKPQMGVTSITDPRGVTTYFDYDLEGRLKESYYIKGISKQVLQYNDYHYSNH